MLSSVAVNSVYPDLLTRSVRVTELSVYTSFRIYAWVCTDSDRPTVAEVTTLHTYCRQVGQSSNQNDPLQSKE